MTYRAAMPPFATPEGGARLSTPSTDIRIAAIDIGSNSIRQIIADVSPTGTIRVIDEMKASPRLGEGIVQTARLSEAAMRNALDALVRMATLSRQMGVHRVEAVATSAVRDAENGSEFLDLVRETTGLRVRVLDGDEEALLCYRSALAHFDFAVGRAVVMDIGGGSLEFVLSAGGLIDGLISLPYGMIRLTEQFLGPSPSRKDLTALRRFLRKGLREQLSRRHWHGAQIIGSGGTLTNLASMVLARQGLDPGRHVHGTVVSRAEVEHLLDALQGMSVSERQMVPGLSPARSDIIIAGLAVIAEVLARLEARELVVSSYGIREGLLLEAASVTPVVADPGVARERSVVQLAERSHYEAPHAQHVQHLALQIFDGIAPHIGLTPEDRRILADAALLHDIGYHINFDEHHKHSYHLIIHAELLGMTPADRVTVANVARYHRGTVPKPTHRNYSALDKTLRRRIKRLSAILRVADGLDRGHAGAVDNVRVEWTDDALRLIALPAPNATDLRLELWGASRKAELLSRVVKMPVEFAGPDGVFPQAA
jgi:exopolyphosphatase / guanosine-5'-triphosphate,3'-diphosphate pyrophosphatase